MLLVGCLVWSAIGLCRDCFDLMLVGGYICLLVWLLRVCDLGVWLKFVVEFYVSWWVVFGVVLLAFV